MTTIKTVLLTALAVCVASSAYAHHSHPYVYDACKTVAIGHDLADLKTALEQ
jgi:hypothetical protein